MLWLVVILLLSKVLFIYLFYFNLKKTIVDFIYREPSYIMGKRKERHSFDQIVTPSFSFATLAKTRATRLHCKCRLTKEIK